MNVNIKTNQPRFVLSNTNNHLLDIYNQDYYVELGTIDIQKLDYLLNHKSLDLADLIYNDLAFTGTGKITNSSKDDIFFQINYLTSLRQKSSSNHFFITCSTICYTDQNGIEKHAPVVLIPIDLDYENYQVMISSSPIVNSLLIKYLESEQKDQLEPESLENENPIRQKRFPNVESIDNFTKEIADKYQKGFAVDNFLTIAKLRQPVGRSNSDVFDVLNSIYEKESSPNVLTKKYFNEVNAILPTNMEQKYALLNAKNGKSFIVNGKLGSGKSYTALNMIVDGISKNKKILYVNQDIDNLFEMKKNLTILKLDGYTYNFAKNIKSIKIPPITLPDFENPAFDYNPNYALDYGQLYPTNKIHFNKKRIIDSHSDDIDKLEEYGRDFSIKGKKITTNDQKSVYKRFYGVSKKDIYEQLAVLKRENPDIKLIHIEKDLEYCEVLQNTKGLLEVEKRLMKNIKPSYEINCWLHLSVIHNNFSPEEISKRTIELYNINKIITDKVKEFALKYRMLLPHNITDLYNLTSDIYLFKSTMPQKNWIEQKKRNLVITAWQDIRDNQDTYDTLIEEYKKIINTDEIINIQEILSQIYDEVFINPEEKISQNEIFINRLIDDTDNTKKLASEMDKLAVKILSEYKTICEELSVENFTKEMFSALFKLAEYLKENRLQKKIYTQFQENNTLLHEMFHKAVTIKKQIDDAKKNFRPFLEKGVKDDFKQASTIFNSSNHNKELNKIFNKAKIRQAFLKLEDVKQSYRYFYEKQQELNQDLVDNTKIGDYPAEKQYDSFIEFVYLLERLNKQEIRFVKSFFDRFIDDEQKLKKITNLILTFVKDVSKINNFQTKLYHYNINLKGETCIEQTEEMLKWESYLLNINDIKATLTTLFINPKDINYRKLLEIKKIALKLDKIKEDFKQNDKRYKELLGDSYRGVETDVVALRQLIERFDEFVERFSNREDIKQIFDAAIFENMYQDGAELHNLYNNWIDKYRQFSICFNKGKTASLQQQSFDENEKTINEFYNLRNQISDVLFVTDWINKLHKFGLHKLANGIEKGEYKVNLSNSYLYSSLVNYRDILEEYDDNHYSKEEFLKNLADYEAFEKDYCTRNILKLQENAKKERDIKEKVINKKLKNIDFNNYNQYLKTINRPSFVCLSDLSAFNSDLDLSVFDLIILDDAHLMDSGLTRKFERIKQVVVLGDHSFKTSVTSNLMIFTINTLNQKNRSSVINFPYRYIELSEDFANEFNYNNQFIISRKRDKTKIEKIERIEELGELVFQEYKNRPDKLINVVVGTDKTRRNIYTYLVKKLQNYYSEEEIHIILNYKIRIINAIYEPGNYADVVYFYYSDIDKRDDKALILRNFSTVREIIHIAFKEKHDDLENTETENEIKQLMKTKRFDRLNSPITNILIKDLRQQKNDNIRIMNGRGNLDVIIKITTKSNDESSKMLGIIIKGKKNELIYSNIDTYNYYVNTYQQFGWEVMLVDIESLVDDYEGIIKQINDKCEQLRR